MPHRLLHRITSAVRRLITRFSRNVKLIWMGQSRDAILRTAVFMSCCMSRPDKSGSSKRVGGVYFTHVRY
jgi:hypothetical protein